MGSREYGNGRKNIENGTGRYGKISVRFHPLGRDVVRDEIEELLRDNETKARALAPRDLARRAVGDGGSSRQNLRRFLNLVRGVES
jgi:hypothetical protein